MLEIRNLTKIYRPKRGVPVLALDHVSLRLPSHGMVFLLGRSGSGKSTLLNLLGGLDRADEGEILIRGVSSQGFGQQHFDSYRNTYVGFIFQEYNVLEEFTVGANIALAIELQGKKATDDQINAILHEVDLDGYGNRRPNELSGGQKQRVAIARALVKQPRIIMADEPTGALDSNTGRQIFDTLKKLSADRLVLVVSHDRDFAEQYADRIVELADGHVISDMTYTEAAEEAAPVGLTYTENTVLVAEGYHLTEEDRLAINAYIDRLHSGLSVKVTGYTHKNAVPTDPESVPVETGGFSLIKSKLPLRSAFKIGASSLKHKRIRLLVTIFLSCISFGLFGLADTFASYNHIRACTDSLMDTGIDYASVTKSIAEYDSKGNKGFEEDYRVSAADLEKLRQETGISMLGVYQPKDWSLDFSGSLVAPENMDEDASRRIFSVYPLQFNGLAEVTEEVLSSRGYTLTAGRLPDGKKDELALPAFVAESFCKQRYTDGTYDAKGERTVFDIRTPADMVGKTLPLGGRTFTVTGIVDTKVDISRYETLLEEKKDLTTAQELARYALLQECSSMCSYSLHTSALVGSGYVSDLVQKAPTVKRLDHQYLYFVSENESADSLIVDPYWIGQLSDAPAQAVEWLNGVKTTLGEKELVVSADLLRIDTAYTGDADDADAVTEQIAADAVRELLKKYPSFEEDSSRRWENGELNEPIKDYTIVGYIDTGKYPALCNTVLTSKAVYEAFTEEEDGIYAFATGVMPREREAVRTLVSYCYDESGELQYPLANSVTFELDTVHNVLVSVSKGFVWAGLFFALFAALMLANFIAVSISYKRQEIGILRAIGSRSNDVFRIFFAESFIIAMINFLLSSVGVGIVTTVINRTIRTQLNVLVTVLGFGIRQIALLLAVSLLVAALASFFPVRRIAAKRPIDAIRGR